MAVAAVVFALTAFKKELNIGTDRQFVWNSSIIDTAKTTAELTQHSPDRQEIVFTADKEWEGTTADSFNIVKADGRYLLYYSTYDNKDAVRICVAESTDGVNWTKPSLGLVTFNGNSNNNILFDADESITDGFFVFCDTNPDCKAGEEYKAVAVSDTKGSMCYVSADGIGWTKTAEGPDVSVALENATLSSIFWNENEQQYYCYFIAEKGGRQNICLSTSKNFSKWSKGKAVSYQKGAQQSDLGSANVSPYYRSNDMLIGLPLRLTGISEDLVQTNFAQNTVTSNVLTDTVFISSFDGDNFSLTEEAWLTPGPQNGSNWTFGDSFVAGGIVETASIHADKGQDYELSVYVAENMLSQNSTSLARYTMRIDGFMSYNAPYSTRKVVTQPLVFGGGRMTVNFATSTDGYVFVRILDKNGKEFGSISYTKEDGTEYSVPEYTSYKMIGDRVDREVMFNGDLSALAGKTVVLEFYLSDADLYSFKFDNEPYSTDSEYLADQIELREYEDFRYADEGTVLDIGTDRQLFWDNYIVDESATNAKLTAYSPVRKEELFRTDKPWEGDQCDFYVIVNDTDSEGKDYSRMYYLGWDSSDFTDIRVCYAYSYDGINWVKPSLGLHSYTDPKTGITHTDTNIVLYTEEEIFDNFFVMKDTREGVPASQRYKAICQGRTDQLGYPSYGLWAWVSADGLHWKKTHRVLPQMNEWFGSFDSVNSLVWDETSGQFFTYFRVRETQEVDGTEFIDYRKIYGATGPEFAPFETETIFPLTYGEGSPLFEMYTNNITKYYRADQIFIGFPTRFSRNFEWAKNYEYLTDPVARLEKFNGGQLTRTLSMTDTMFITSRDGYVWNRQNEAYITPGPEYQANWIYGNCYPAYGLIETTGDTPGADNQLSTYLFEGKFYNEPSVFYRYALRLDGFKSYKGSYAGQKVTTKAFTFEGDQLVVNFKTSAAGSVTINMLDENGKKIDGCTAVLVGDNTDRVVSFEKDLGQLNGTAVSLEFTLCDAEIYSFKFQ